MIRSKKDLAFYIAADRIMNGYPVNKSFVSRIRETYLVGGSKVLIIRYLYHLRKYAYYYNTHKRHFSWNTVMMLWEHYKLTKLAIKCGFSIGQNSLGYGVVIPHHGTIVINSNAQIGNYAVLHTCTCIAGGEKKIGDGMYLSSGSQIVGKVNLGDWVTIAAHSLVNKSFEDHCLIAGAPAIIKRVNESKWFESPRDKERYSKRIEIVERTKHQIYG